MRYQDGLRHASAHLDPVTVLHSEVSVLLGVTDPVVTLLAGQGVRTVLDLATLPLLARAREIVEAAESEGAGPLGRLDRVPGGYATEEPAPTIEALAGSPLTALRGVTPELATALGDTLQVATVGDLGRWLPFRFARLVLAVATGADPGTADDAAELVPRMGEYPTERCFYSTVVIDHVETTTTRDLASAGAVDLAPAVQDDFGFSVPAVGARLTFAQSWFAHGVTLGNLLHSVALAPGESTRIAVVDWSRQSRSTGTEAISESERLSNTTSHNRALSEVQEAVANEAQTGFSSTDSSSTTFGGGLSAGATIGPVSIGGSASAAKTKTHAESFSTSSGSRDLAASMSQKVMDATHQAASSVRDRRASLVLEVSEQEHESVSTRILANYNHMHALTVQYYEVVELYRVRVELNQVERCLFIPMKLVSFDEATIRRYQGVLADAALDRQAREMLGSEFGTVKVTSLVRSRPFLSALGVATIGGVTMMARMATDTTPDSTTADSGTPPTPPATPPAPPRPPVTDPRPVLDAIELARASRIVSLDVVRPGSSDVFLPRDAALTAAVFRIGDSRVPVTGVSAKPATGGAAVVFSDAGLEWRAPGALPLSELSELVVTAGALPATGTGQVTLELTYRGALFPVTLPISFNANASFTVVRFGDQALRPELVEHLNANRLHYSQAIWRSLDASTLALLLSPFAFEGLPVVDLVDPEPVMIAGNYVVLRMPAFTARRDSVLSADAAAGAIGAAQAAWRRWLSDRGLQFGGPSTTEQLVPIPTGGVFGEAVLGRSNSAEKLDATRFWNWQDSPIPLAPPEIAAINMGSRAQASEARPGQLGQPVLNIVSPTSLPDPTGVGAVLGAVQNGSMFRDMSGLGATIGLAQSLAGTSAGAAATQAQIASANMMAAQSFELEKRKIDAGKGAAAAATAASPAAQGGTPRNASEMGAALNTARALDAAGVRSGGGGSGSSGGGGTGGGSGDFMPGIEGSPGGGGGSSDGFTGDAMRRLLHGATGMPVGDILLADTGGLADKGGAGGGSGGVTVAEVWCYGQADRDTGFNTVAQEIGALLDGTWHPSTVDFKAIIERSNGMVPPTDDMEVEGFLELLNILARPASRVNFIVYGGMDFHTGSTPSIWFSPRIDPGLTEGFSVPLPEPRPETPALTMESLLAFRESINLRSMRGVATLINAIGERQRATPDRRLWWYQVAEGGNRPLLQALATFLGMPVMMFADPIQFVPDFDRPVAATATSPARPGRINVRGQVGFGISREEAMQGGLVKDLHKFDGKAIQLIP